MKKIFSLVALVGIFALMSFSFKAEQKEKVQEWDYCNEYATEYAQTYDWSPGEQRSWYYKCLAMQ